MIRIIFTILVWAMLPQLAFGDKWDQSFGNWQLYCVDGAKPSPDNCSVMENVFVKEEGYLVRVVVEITDIARFKIEVPVDSYFLSSFGDGVILKHIVIHMDDEKESVLLPIRDCMPGYCESLWVKKPSFPKERFLIELRIDDENGIRIGIPLEGFAEAVKALEDRLNMPPQQ